MSIVVAMAENRVIGRQGKMPWHIPGELKIFRQRTTGKNLIMGRKTHESIGRVLPDRTSIIITRQKDYAVPGAHVVHSLDEALALARKLGGDIVVGGGAELYEQTLAMVDVIHLTLVHAEFDGETLFPEISPDQFREVSRTAIEASIPYTLITYERIKA